MKDLMANESSVEAVSRATILHRADRDILLYRGRRRYKSSKALSGIVQRIA